MRAIIVSETSELEGNTLDLPERITIKDVEERISIPLYTIK